MPSEAQSGTINTGLKINNSVLIVSAPFYKEITNCLKEGAISILNKFGLEYEELQVPGALEIPTAISILGNKFRGFIALGCVIRGETTHYDTVCQNSSRALTNLGLKGFCIGNGFIDESFPFSIITISPFLTSLKNLAPTISNAHVSDAKIYELSSLPIINGLIPKGSLTPTNFLLVIRTNA